MATEKQIAANRANGLKGGVKTPEGKAISRMNARKHGIFAVALTEHDAEGLRGLLDELIEHSKPVGIVEQLLVDKLAVTYMRMQRCAQAETIHYKYRWNMFPAQFGKFGYDETLVTIGLYDARLTNQFLRLLHELEWRQKARTAPGSEPQISQIAQIPSQEARPGKPANAPAAGENPGNANLQNEPNVTFSVAQPFDKPFDMLRAVSNVERPPTAVQHPQAGAPAPHTKEARENPPEPEMKNEPKLTAQPSATVEPSLDSLSPIESGDGSRGNDRPETPAPIPQVRNEPEKDLVDA